MKKLLVVLLGLASLNVYANGCGGEYQPATGTCRIIDSSGRQILYNVGSNSGLAQSQPSVVNIDVPSRYGAWAINLKTGISADAINAPSLEVAKKGAIKACEQNGKNAPCKVKAWVRNGCLAVAKGKLNGKWMSFPRSEAPGLVEDKALKACQTSGYSQCTIAVPEGCSMPKF
ncbi:hypothetical protein HMPREF3052_02695 [Neisseria sp. HMSC056A03]|uniref:DUF4189 domain-containing protein n=1 Tax=Neisseria sp. HMSC056A03 TaxID=1739544 RepID=UPI0008A1F244|nr:DUF4189 domain-containing protein [Neisseria sp. HMSC056A03]OFO30201.1 hypothetical protein HMPREF3052_02695 [Neisseria sp. HMSC056A03]